MMTTRFVRYFASLVPLALVLIATAACSSESDPGEACDRPGGTSDVCSEGTVCGKPTSKSENFVCVFICDENKQCPKDYDCNGVEGTSIKGCRFKD
jgi:hypothetical protein